MYSVFYASYALFCGLDVVQASRWLVCWASTLSI